MKPEMSVNLLSFYFGSVGENERLRIERVLLEDPEVLVDYLDLKRRVESAEEIPQGPSRELWPRLAGRIARTPRRTWFAVSVGIAVAASVFFCLAIFSKPKERVRSEIHSQGILFDPGHELSGGSGVL